MHPFRSKMCHDIAVEFLPPSRGSRDVVVLCDGFPSVPAKKEVLEFFSKNNFWVFHPRYRGAWESGGRLLAKEPTKDILDVIKELPKGFTEFWQHKKFRLRPNGVFVVGSSFGGTAALLASGSPLVTASVAMSPVVDWLAKSKTEPLPKLRRFVREAFGNAFRIDPKGWNRLGRNGFYQPVDSVERIAPKKTLIIHCKDDDIITPAVVKKFAAKIGIRYIEYGSGGHISLRDLPRSRRYWRGVKNFIDKFSTATD